MQHAQSLSILANSTAVALTNARTFTERERALAELAALNQIAQSIGSAMELEQVLTVIREQMGPLIDSDNFFIALYDEDEDMVTFAMAFEDGQRVYLAATERRPGTNGVRHSQPAAPAHPRAISRASWTGRGIKMIVSGWEPQGWLGVPLLLRDKVVGVMATQSRQPDRFDETHQRVLVAIGSQAAIAIEKARLLQDAVQKTTQLSSLYEVGKRTSALMTDAGSLLPWIADEAARLLHADAAGFRILENGRLVLGRAHGRRPGDHDRQPIPVDGQPQWSHRDRQPAIISTDLTTDPRSPRERREEAARKGYRGFLGIPLRLRGQPVGVLNVYTRYSRQWSQADIDLLFAFADQAVIAMENTRLYQALSDQAHRDSLTQVYNHGYLLECLQKLVDEAADAGLHDHAGYRPLQGVQRPLRARVRRFGVEGDRSGDSPEHPSGGRGGPLGRRGVRRAAAAYRRGKGPGRGRTHPADVEHDALGGRLGADRAEAHGEPGNRHLSGQRHVGGRSGEQGRCGALRGQGRGARPHQHGPTSSSQAPSGQPGGPARGAME